MEKNQEKKIDAPDFRVQVWVCTQRPEQVNCKLVLIMVRAVNGGGLLGVGYDK